MSKLISQEQIDNMRELLSQEEIASMWYRMHTPIVRTHRKIGRNEICPFCGSGKKFKNCECYEKHKNDYAYNK